MDDTLEQKEEHSLIKKREKVIIETARAKKKIVGRVRTDRKTVYWSDLGETAAQVHTVKRFLKLTPCLSI